MCVAYYVHVSSYMGSSEPSQKLESPKRDHQAEARVIEGLLLKP